MKLSEDVLIREKAILSINICFQKGYHIFNKYLVHISIKITSNMQSW